MPIRIIRHTAQKMKKKLLFWLGITSINSFNVLPVLLLNKTVLVVKQDCFTVLADKYLCDQNHY